MSAILVLLFTLSAPKQPAMPCNQGSARCAPITPRYQVPMRPPRLRDPVGPRK